ncbi:MAG TPA: penicillin acylase family protein [Acidobacteriaceae bacterium]|nr:penicillin acylase family protein [Acidobacteriaceae bacterium]
MLGREWREARVPGRRVRRRRVLWLSISTLLLLALLAGVGLFAGSLWLRHAMRESLPQLDGQLRLPGLTAPVIIRRDHHGVPQIQAANLDDLFIAQGYVTAQDRLWQMDMARRFASGNTASILGPSYVKHDRMQRTLLMRQTAEHMVSNLSNTNRRYLQDYARGVNAFINTHEDNLPAEFRLLMYKPRPWQPVDSALIMLDMVQLLDQRWDMKLDREHVVARLGPTLAAQLYPIGSWRDHPPTQPPPDLSSPSSFVPEVPLDPSQSRLNRPSLPQPSVNDLLQLRQLVEGFRIRCPGCVPGSNEWVVSGAHTASGKPILSNDMHLPYNIPGIWYEAGLKAPGFHAAGLTIPGVPFIIAGHNDHIAWGFTAMYADMEDLYVEQTNAQGNYRAPDGTWRPIEHHREAIRVRGGSNVTFDVASTDHGPVITPLIPHETRTIALRWSVYDVPEDNIPLFALDTASDWTSFRAALSRWTSPSLNTVYADDQGHIGYQAIGQIPNRPNGLMDVPITDSNHEWNGYIPFDQLPSSLDPPNGIIATANSRMTPNGYPYPISDDWADPYRNERIWKWLAGKNNLTSADMLTLQTDVYSAVDQELAQRFAYAIDHAENTDRRQREAANILRTWQGRVSANSPAAAIVSAAKAAFWPMILRPKLGKAWRLYRWDEKGFAQEQFITNNPQGWLPPGYKTWDDFLAAVVKQALATAPLDLHHWTYGEAHTIHIEHPLFGHLPWFRRWIGVGPLPMPGDTTTVLQSGSSFGPSQRFTIDWANPGAATENIVLGQSGDPLSPYYRDQWPYWYNGKTFVLPYSDAAVQAQTTHTLTLVP